MLEEEPTRGDEAYSKQNQNEQENRSMRHESIVGTWSLVSLIAKSSKGDEFFPYGEHPMGMIIYSDSGDMAVVLMRAGRSKFASGDLLGGTAEEIREAFEGFDAYGGTYEVDVENGVITHQIQVARFPNWEGTAQVRYFKRLGDQLLLSTPPIPALDQEWVVEVVLERNT
jgi:hypothetical protein